SAPLQLVRPTFTTMQQADSPQQQAHHQQQPGSEDDGSDTSRASAGAYPYGGQMMMQGPGGYTPQAGAYAPRTS
ncbi:hypothetical protein PMAYCL1PPCAC_20356, partial [Pristionchus mayeri]